MLSHTGMDSEVTGLGFCRPSTLEMVSGMWMKTKLNKEENGDGLSVKSLTLFCCVKSRVSGREKGIHP